MNEEFEKWWNEMFPSTGKTQAQIALYPHVKAAFLAGAAEVIQFIVDQGTISVCDGEEAYYVVAKDVYELKQKFGLEI